MKCLFTSSRSSFPATFALAAALALGTSYQAHAVEGGIGRPLAGASINPYAAVVPPAPGFSASITEIYYEGGIGGSVVTPVGLNLALNLDAHVSYTNFALTYIWDTPGKSWNFASAVTLPLVYLDVEANVTLGPLTGRRKDSDFGLYDIILTPIVASWHLSETDHLAFNLNIWAPTGDYDANNLANLGLNTWTFIPGIAYTKLFPQSNIELSAMWAVQFYTENSDTGYENGILSDLEVLAVKRFDNGFGLGVIGGWVEQLTDDKGTAPAPFKGSGFGAGPILSYSTKLGDSPLDFSARWIHEFGAENRFEGNTFMLGAGLKF